MLKDTLEYYWVTGNEETRLKLPDEACILNSQFRKRIGDSDTFEVCELRLFPQKIYMSQGNTLIGFVRFSFELTFEMMLEPEKEETGPSKSMVSVHHEREIIAMKLDKDMCDCEFIAVDKKVYSLWQKELAKKLTQKNFYAYYDVKRVIGQGAYASVVIAEKKSTGEQFAVKSLSKAHIYHSPDGKAEIQNELHTMRQLRHDNLMRLYEVFDTDSSIKIVLELVEGGQLLDALKTNLHLNWFEIGTIMKQLLAGLEVMHAENIMHRDLKPENILMRSKNDLKLVIADFGLATKADEEKYLYLKCGTPGYVAPEVVNLPDNATHYETKCDIFSVGAIFYRLCVHKPLFQGTTHAEVLQENKSMKFSLTCPDVKDLPLCAQDLLQKLLEADPKKRIKASDALKHPFFKEVADHEGQKNKSPFKGDVERARHLLKQEKKRNNDIPENSPLKMKQPLITGKIKPVQPNSQINRRGSFTQHSVINMQSAGSTPSSRHSSKGSIVGFSTKDRKASLESIEEDEETAAKREIQPKSTPENNKVAQRTKGTPSLTQIQKSPPAPQAVKVQRRATMDHGQISSHIGSGLGLHKKTDSKTPKTPVNTSSTSSGSTATFKTLSEKK